MNFQIKKPFLLLLCLVFNFSLAQKKISKSHLQEELVILKRNLEQLHGGLYAYTSKDEMNDWFNKTKSTIIDSMSSYAFYNLLAPLNSVIKNGHTNISYPKFGNSYYFLPIQLYKYKDSFFIKKLFSKQHKNIEGTQIIEIEGVPIREIYERLLKNHRRDGNNLTMPNENLSNLFGLEYTLVYGKKSNYNLTIDKNGEKHQVSLSQELLDDEIIKQYRNNGKPKPLEFRIKDDIAVLTFPTFDTKSLKKLKYKTLLKNAFSKIKSEKIEHLVIDVRNNGGGDPVPTQELLSYLLDEEFVMYKDVYTIDNKIKDRKYYKKQGVFSFNLFSWLSIKKIEDNLYRRRNKEGMDTYLSKENNFKGQLYILTNGNSFSATGEFTSFVKYHRKNTSFIGEEVGGNKFQNTSGIDYTITLPYSKQRVVIPLVIWEMNINAKNDGHGIKPDYWVRNTIEQEQNSIDGVMKFTRQHIKKMNTSKL